MPYEKDPTEKKDYKVDWSRQLTAGDTISTSAWTIAPSGLTKSQETNTTTTTTVWLAAGTVGVLYRISNHVVTAQGRELERSFEVNVTDL